MPAVMGKRKLMTSERKKRRLSSPSRKYHQKSTSPKLESSLVDAKYARMSGDPSIGTYLGKQPRGVRTIHRRDETFSSVPFEFQGWMEGKRQHSGEGVVNRRR